MHLAQAVRALSTLGIGHEILASGAEGAVLVVPDCGRALGLWPHWRAENALWIDPGFFDRLAGGTQREDWVDPGGDRLQLWPDKEFLDPVGGVPPAVDPGRYERLPAKGLCIVQNRADVWAAASRVRVAFRLERRLRPLAAAELADRWGAGFLRSAGWEEDAVLELAPGSPRVGLHGVTRVRPSGAAWLALRRYWADTALAAESPGSFELAAGCAVVALEGRGGGLELSATEARPLLLHLEELGGGRAMLLARCCRWDEAGAGLSVRGRGAGAELAMRSPLAGGDTGRAGLTWRQELAAFTGRSAEVRALAERIGEGGR